MQRMTGNPLAQILQASVDERRDEVLEPEPLPESELLPTFAARTPARIVRP